MCNIAVCNVQEDRLSWWHSVSQMFMWHVVLTVSCCLLCRRSSATSAVTRWLSSVARQVVARPHRSVSLCQIEQCYRITWRWWMSSHVSYQCHYRVLASASLETYVSYHLYICDVFPRNASYVKKIKNWVSHTIGKNIY